LEHFVLKAIRYNRKAKYSPAQQQAFPSLSEKRFFRMNNYKDSYQDAYQDNYKDACYWADGYKPRRRHRPQINQTILACGTGTGLVFPESGEPNFPWIKPQVLASVTLDTSELKKANVKIDFSCIIKFRDNDADDLRLTFQLVKTNQYGSRIPLANWNFARDFQDNDRFETIDSFSFTWCQCEDCPGCYTYTVELIKVEAGGVDRFNITNPSINALAVGPLADDYASY